MPNRATTVSVPRTDLAGYLMETRPTQNYLTGLIFPAFTVPDKTGNIVRVPLEAMLTAQDVKRSKGAKYNRSEFDTEEDTYSCKEYGHEYPMDDGEARVYRKAGQYDRLIAERLRTIILVQQDIRAAALVHNTTTFPQSGNTGLGVTHEWDDQANAVPIDDINEGREGLRARGSPTNNLVLEVSYLTWYDLWNCDSIRDNMKYVVAVEKPDPSNAAARQVMARTLGVADVIIADAYYNSALQGATPVISDIWSREYAFLFQAPMGQDITEPCLGRTYSWEEDGGAFAVETYRDESARSDVMRARQVVQEKIINSNCGYLFSNIVT
jgi:hypothetical protein